MADRKAKSRKRKTESMVQKTKDGCMKTPTSALHGTLAAVLSFPDQMSAKDGRPLILGLSILCPKDVRFPPVAGLIQEVAMEINDNAVRFKRESLLDLESLISFSSMWFRWLENRSNRLRHLNESKSNDSTGSGDWEQILIQGFVLSARNSGMLKRFLL